MKVYTHYYKAKDAENTEFRWRTLLQFGDTWDVIGSVVMKNPGSSGNKKLELISAENILGELKKFDDSENKWYEFNADQTMKRIKNLFGCYYDTENLQGVIQIFNIFYVKDENLQRAVKNDNAFPFKNNLEILEEDLNNLKIPIYLGFGTLRNKNKYRDRCKAFFEAAKSLGMSYCSENYAENKFTHPLASVCFGKKKSEYKNSLQDFINSKETL